MGTGMKQAGLLAVAIGAWVLPPRGYSVDDGALQSKALGGHPIDAEVCTTLDKTICPCAIRPRSSRVLPREVKKYGQYGYGAWHEGVGRELEMRRDLKPGADPDEQAVGAVTLLSFFVLGDARVTDEETPAGANLWGYSTPADQGGDAANNPDAWAPQMIYTTHVLDAAVQTINALHEQEPFDFGVALGDAINNNQYNELRWYIDVLDGKNVRPDSGAKDDPVRGPYNDHQDEYKAAGLDKSLPWYQVIGSHDQFYAGMLPVDDYIRRTLVGDTILNIGNIYKDPLGTRSRGYYMGVVDGASTTGEVTGAGPVAKAASTAERSAGGSQSSLSKLRSGGSAEGAGSVTGIQPPAKVIADRDRRALSAREWMGEFFKTDSVPAGHGFTQENIDRGSACYAFEPREGYPIKVIVLDNTDKRGGGAGALDQDRYTFLVGELDAGQAEGQLMIVAAHVPIGVRNPDGTKCPMFSEKSEISEEKLLAKLHTYSNLILWISGKRGVNTITPQRSPDPGHPEFGFWEVETASLRDFPQQIRVIDINLNYDNTISIFATNVDPAAKAGSLAEKARSYAIASRQTFGDPNTPDVGSLQPYNAELIKYLESDTDEAILSSGAAIND